MRTTFDLPDELFHVLEMRAAARGESVDAIVTRAITRELGAPRPVPVRVDLPLVGEGESPVVELSNEDIADALD